MNYWGFQRLQPSTIGTAGQGYGSDFPGRSGAAGSAWFNGFTVKGVGGTSPSLAHGFYGGGNFTLQEASTTTASKSRATSRSTAAR